VWVWGVGVGVGVLVVVRVSLSTLYNLCGSKCGLSNFDKKRDLTKI